MLEYKKRADVPLKYQMQLTDYFKDDQEWEQVFQKTQEKVKEVVKFQQQSISGKMVEDFLKWNIEVSNTVMDLYVYAYLSHDVQLEVDKYITMKNKILALNTTLESETAFFEPKLLKLEPAEFANLFQENPSLEQYRVLLTDIYELKGHILSENEEKLISYLTETYEIPENISSSLINSEHNYGVIRLEDGKRIQIAANNLRYLKQNPHREIRKNAYNKFGKVIAQYQNTESNLLNQYIKNNVNLAHIRHYNSSWEAKLASIHITDAVFENLKKAAKKGKKSWQNYFALIKENLGLDSLTNYDTLVDWTDYHQTYTIEEAEDLIKEALQILGSDYEEKLAKIFACHYIDYCQYKGKVSGGYSFATNTHDSRIILSFNGNFDDVLTVAHECGHNVHHQYVKENNPSWYCDTSSFVAEVASLTNEFLVNSYLAQNGHTKMERLQGIEHTLKTFQNNFFDAIMEAEMEQMMYAYVESGNTITAPYLNNLVKETKKEYLGNCIKHDRYESLSWVTRSHYYMHFYLYSYALCVSVAAIVARKILNNEPGFLEKYKQFLSCGSNMYPEEIYQTLGIDLQNPEVFEGAVQFFDSQIEEYKKIKGGAENE